MKLLFLAPFKKIKLEKVFMKHYVPNPQRGAVVEWLEWFGYAVESRRKA